jgi:hypothetical protein
VYIHLVPIHASVLDAALRLCGRRGGWTFRPIEIVAALPALNAASVRTHVMSRCCVNAPAHHAHRWPYFKRVGRGVYQILPALRSRRPAALPEAPAQQGSSAALGANPRAAGATGSALWRPGGAPVSVEIRESEGRYVARSAALPAEIEGDSLERVVRRVIRLARQKLRKEGWTPAPLRAILSLLVDSPAAPPAPHVAAYARDIDRTLIRENLRLSTEERLDRLQSWMEAVDEIRGAARRAGPRPGKT